MIPGEDREWFCPNCGQEANGRMETTDNPRFPEKIRVVVCKICHQAFQVTLIIGRRG